MHGTETLNKASESIARSTRVAVENKLGEKSLKTWATKGSLSSEQEIDLKMLIKI